MKQLPRPVLIIAAITLFILTAMSIERMTEGARQDKGVRGKHEIALEQASQYVKNFRDKPAVPTIKGEYFERAAIEKLLSQKGVVGIRYYHAMKDDTTSTIIIVGVDSLGNDIESGDFIENGTPCPPFCSSTNELNK